MWGGGEAALFSILMAQEKRIGDLKDFSALEKIKQPHSFPGTRRFTREIPAVSNKYIR